MTRQFPRLLGTTTQMSAVERVQNEIVGLGDHAEALLKQLDDEQTANYDKIASLSLQIQHLEAEIQRGADLARRLQQIRSVLETGIEERDA